MEAILIVIEKGEHSYSAYSPNLLGCNAIGKTREEVEKAIIAAVEERLELLRMQAQRGLEEVRLIKGQVDNNVQCLALTNDNQPCRNKSTKDGLCSPHWKILYGHKMSGPTTASKRYCLICGYKEKSNELVGPFDSCPKRR